MKTMLGSFLLILTVFSSLATTSAFYVPLSAREIQTSPTALSSTKPGPKKKGYEPKWKKKETLSQSGGPTDFKDMGLKGTVPVVFKQGNETRSTMALPGQPLRDVASQANQFIKYGCGKGECGTCECLVNGQWVRPCNTNVPGTLAPDEEYTVIVKEIKNKSKSSGKFYSVRSFFMGFYNNLLGMVGLVKFRRAAKENWNERQEYEDLIRRKTLERKQEGLKQGNDDMKKLSP